MNSAKAAGGAASYLARDMRAELGPYLRIGLPLLATHILQMAMGLTDTLMAGRAGSLQLAGVAVGTGTWFPMVLGIIGVLFVLPAMVANLDGAKQNEEIAETTRQAAWLSLVAGLLVTLLSVTLVPLMYEMVGVEPQTRRIARLYILIVGVSAPFLAFSVVLRCYSEGLGFTLPVTVITLITTALNVPLNWVFIYGKLGMPALGGVGCALASGLLNIVSMLLVLAYTHWHPRYAPTRVLARFSWPHWPRMREILALGLPVGATLFIELSMFAGATVLISRLPPEVTAGHQIALQIASLAFMVPLSIGLTATIRVGNHLGAQNQLHAIRASVFALLATLLFAGLNSTLMVAGRHWLPMPFSTEEQVLRVASYLLLYAAAFQLFDGLQGAAMGCLRGYKDTFVPFVLVALCYWAMGLPLGIALAFDPQVVDWLRGLLGMAATARPLDAPGLWIAMNLSLLAVAGLLLWRLFVIQRRHLRAAREQPRTPAAAYT